MKDYCKYVDVFYGNGEVDHYDDTGLGSKWYYIKALCGNTIPNAVLPFGMMSVGAYSGGYPCGYGTHFPNYCGGIRKISDKMKIRGFSHVHHSGTGGIKYYYNYAIVTPFYGDIQNTDTFYEAENESAVPGRYSVTMNDVFCSVTVSRKTAMHLYSFRKDGGRIAVDFSNDGLLKEFGKQFYSYPKNCTVRKTDGNEVCFDGILSGVRLYFCVRVLADNATIRLFDGNNTVDGDKLFVENSADKFGAVFDFDGNCAKVLVSYSTLGSDEARKNIDACSTDFDELSSQAYSTWNKYLSSIDITADDSDKQKFYSNFYHSLVKPANFYGENILGIKDFVVSDIETFWDQYKTVFPLIFMLYDDISELIARTIVNISKTHGKILCSFGLSDIYPCEEQAKMLGILTLCDAYHFGVKGVEIKDIEECILRELSREDYKGFLESGVFERYTHILDVADACKNVAVITKNEVLKAKLQELAKCMSIAYGADGLMSDNSKYYEGDRYTYSFRLHADMDRRIAIAGGKERFREVLDKFFGFGQESIVQPRYLGSENEINSSHHHRFQGFNNECDMETPYAYIYADDHDKLCRIVHQCVNMTFALGKGALPGNNDSGGLSSCYMFNALGLFPASGKGDFLLGTPAFEKAEIHLSGGKLLTVSSQNYGDGKYLVDKVVFNGEEIDGYVIKTEKILEGGNLVFTLR